MVAVAVLVAFVASLSACGGETATVTKSQAAFIARADPLCLQARHRLEPYRLRLHRLLDGTQANLEEAGPPLIRKMADMSAAALVRVRALPLPADKPARARAYFDALARQVALYRQWADALDAGDGSRGVRIEQEIGRAGDRAHRAAVAFGFKVCGRRRG